jgi:hypothetical protein
VNLAPVEFGIVFTRGSEDILEFGGVSLGSSRSEFLRFFLVLLGLARGIQRVKCLLLLVAVVYFPWLQSPLFLQKLDSTFFRKEARLAKCDFF